MTTSGRNWPEFERRSEVLLLKGAAKPDMASLTLGSLNFLTGPSSNAINVWFWNRTVAGALLRALRTAALASEDRGFNTVGSRFIVPAPWVSPTPGA